jgi:hypothetical protein
VVLTNDQGETWVLDAVAVGRTYRYGVCFLDRRPGPYPPIEGSNGGTGIPVTYTVTITNEGGRAVRDVFAELRAGMNPDGTVC